MKEKNTIQLSHNQTDGGRSIGTQLSNLHDETREEDYIYINKRVSLGDESSPLLIGRLYLLCHPSHGVL